MSSATRPERLHALGHQLQENPSIYLTSLPGPWLLERTSPSWRISDPVEGFQRVVQERRAREIATAVLEQRRTFPNAIVLATDLRTVEVGNCGLYFPVNVRFMVVDGQHRLWAQRFSSYAADYPCLIHTGLDEVAMARLFLEINDNQKRVPSSLRWDLVRLVRPEEDPGAIAATDLVYSLATDEESPLFQRIDLTGEQPEIQLKQGSLAPDIRVLLRRPPFKDITLHEQYHLLSSFFIALQDRDPDGWRRGNSAFYKARVIRALLRLLPEMIEGTGRPASEISADDLLELLDRIDEATLAPDAIRAAQGSAGIKAIYDQLRAQVFGEA